MEGSGVRRVREDAKSGAPGRRGTTKDAVRGVLQHDRGVRRSRGTMGGRDERAAGGVGNGEDATRRRRAMVGARGGGERRIESRLLPPRRDLRPGKERAGDGEAKGDGRERKRESARARVARVHESRARARRGEFNRGDDARGRSRERRVQRRR